MNQISVSSPIGKAMVGKEEGDEFEFTSPGGVRIYEVLEVSYD